MCIKKVKLINHDCLPILMLLYGMLYIMLAYSMLFVCIKFVLFIFLPLIFANAFCFHALSWFINTYVVYFKYYFAQCF